jgi:hypothetical protein
MSTNVREGLRRLGHVLGVLGIILGGFIGYLFFEEVHPLTWKSILLCVSIPILGFLLPWGAIRALSWVLILTGFSSKPNRPTF